jgi:hypothetical protein
MKLVCLLCVVGMFFVLTPGILFRLPKHGSIYMAAAVHAFIFAAIWLFAMIVLHKIVNMYVRHGEGYRGQGTAQGTAQGSSVKALHTNPINEQCRKDKSQLDQACCEEWIKVKGKKYPAIHWNQETSTCECAAAKCPKSWQKRATAKN